MADPELGTKRTCPDTGKNFYDLNKDPIVSPYSGNSFPLSFFEDEKTKPKKEEKPAKEAPESDDDDDIEDEDIENQADADEEAEVGEDEAKELGGDENEVALDLSGDGDDDEAPGKVPTGFTEDGVDDDDDDDDDDIDIDEEFDLGSDIEIDDDDDNTLGEPDADDIEADDK
ncbi:MAG: TIGR02300 family protein [Pseudomonadota bacterium]